MSDTMSELVIEPQLDLDAIREELGIRDGWTPETEEDFDRVANYYLWCDDEERRLKDMHKLRIKRLQARRTYLDYRYLPVIMDFAKSNIVGTKRSFDLPTARLQFRNQPARWVVSDGEALDAWIKTLTPAQREALKIKEVVAYEWDKQVLFTEANEGMVIPGVTYVPEGESFSVVAAK